MYWAASGDNGELVDAIQTGLAADNNATDTTDDNSNNAETNDTSNNTADTNIDENTTTDDNSSSTDTNDTTNTSNTTNDDEGNNTTVNNTAMSAWSGAAVSYELGDLVSYNGYIYKVVLAHISVANWYPDQVWYFEQQQ